MADLINQYIYMKTKNILPYRSTFSERRPFPTLTSGLGGGVGRREEFVQEDH